MLSIFAWVRKVLGFKAIENDSSDALELVVDKSRVAGLKIVERPTRNKMRIKKKEIL